MAVERDADRLKAAVAASRGGWPSTDPNSGMSRTALFAEALKQMGYHHEALTGNMRPGSSVTDKALRPLDHKIVFEIAKREGLTTAKSLDEFRGNDTITRSEAATVLVRSTGEQVNSTEEGLQRAVDLGLFNSVGDGTAEFKNRFLPDVLGRGQGVLPERPTLETGGLRGPDGNVIERPTSGMGDPATEPPAAPTPPPATTSTTSSDADNVLEDEFVEAAQEAQDARDALEIIKDSLRQYGLEGLSGEAYNMLIEGSSPEAVVLRLRETEQFQERFKGMEMRREAGFPAISPGEYIALERNYKQTMIAAGIPEGFYDSPDDFAAFIGNDVSPNEMSQRVAMAAAAVQSVDPNLKTQLQDLYGIGVENDGELTAYFLDPDRGVNVIEQRLQMEAAGLSSAAVGTLGGGFERDTAERLADLNVQRREITERMQGQRGLTQRLVGEERAVTTSELAAAEFGLDSDATADVKRLRQQRQQRGRREMGSLVTGAGVTGLGRAT